MQHFCEPSVASLRNPALRYVAATRPAFLAVTLFGCLVGFAASSFDGARLDALRAAVTLVFALVAHAGANVLNDYFDAVNGTDDINTGRIFPPDACADARAGKRTMVVRLGLAHARGGAWRRRAIVYRSRSCALQRTYPRKRRSSRRPMWNSACSLPTAATSWTATGMPCSSVPTGTTSAGSPNTLAMTT